MESTKSMDKTSAKQQPWKAVWPAPREPQSQANMFGFKKGETMVFDGNAGNFFAREKWEIESETLATENDNDAYLY
ncbi:hypothetical protein LTR62_000921 [Meristemomyces frigidus]|uniref:Uncharacterized protein n=1 Tax=Meristemomyces frigidus TaxID=1508187 RepID=A0AAN7T9V7_9PEZI|nr:hypothetical protein LTR62_000921 [Meristemomyces frigidus]